MLFCIRSAATAKNIIKAFSLMVFFASCSSQTPNNELLQYRGQFPDESAENMVLTISDSGVISFVVEAPVFNSYIGDSSYTDCPEGVKVLSFTEYGQEQAKLTAKYACNINNYMYKASDSVVICDLMAGDTLLTEEIIWDQRKRRVYSNKLVTQHKADGSVNYGDGFEADERFSKYTIWHPRGELNNADF